MQVATLFRESATLLGASMETGGVGNGPVPGGIVPVPVPVPGPPPPPGHVSDGPAPPGPGPGPLHLSLDNFSHPNSNKFKLNMKLESHDDGYETSADLMMSNATNHNDSLKCESLEDPYSFIDEDPMPELSNGQALSHCVPSITQVAQHQHTHPHITLPAPKKRGRKKKIKIEPGLEYDMGMNGTNPPKVKERKKHDRFNGMPEEEVSKRTLPDHLATNLDIIIIGINPGLFAAYKGHHYAGPGNHFWKCLYLSGLTPEQMTADEDYKLLQVGIGFTNMVQRPTKGSADLTRKEIKEGCQILLEKLQRFKPKIAVFNGKLIYEVFSGKKDFSFGRQPDLVDGTNTYMWVMPSSSARCAQLPRAADKVPFYAALKKFRDYLNGIVTSIDDSEVVFSDSRLKSCCEPEPKSESLYSSMDLMDISNAIVKRDEVVPCKKKRGRPKKNKVEGEEYKPVVKKPAPTQNVNNCDFPKKKRGRPKKNKCEDLDVSLHERNTRTPISKCFSTPSPIHSPTNFCHMSAALTPSNSSSSAGGGMYGGMPMQHTQQPYSASPRPHSQPFTHSDLSSEISAAISSDQLGSPAPTSPSLGPPDFDPPTSMPTDDTTECRFSSPAPSTVSEQPPPPYPSYHTFGLDGEGHRFSQSQPQPPPPGQPRSNNVQDMASKSLSGLESLVDQIPSIAEGEAAAQHGLHLGGGAGDPDGYGAAPGGYAGYGRNSPSTSPVGQTSYNYPLGNQYQYPYGSGGGGGGWGQGFMEHHVPQMWPYGQQFPQSGYASPGLHVPSPNYPSPVAPPHYYYNAAQAQPGPHSPPYLHAHTAHMFDRIKPDIGYGSF